MCHNRHQRGKQLHLHQAGRFQPPQKQYSWPVFSLVPICILLTLPSGRLINTLNKQQCHYHRGPAACQVYIPDLHGTNECP